MSDVVQEFIDRFYWDNGPCCAGCDWWRSLNSTVGECVRSEPVSARERYDMIGIDWCSVALDAGHVLTLRGHHCGEFKDEFNWFSLPAPYLRRIGARPGPRPTPGDAA